MIESKLADSFGVAVDVVPAARLEEFSHLASQTSLQERESLYAVTRYVYSGEGDIWDIGCAAGGSSFCLAAGLKDNREISTKRKVKCFDLFNGYSGKCFEGKFPNDMSDLDIFHVQTRSVRDFVEPVTMDLITGLESYKLERPIEVAHIDAAKSLAIWKSIFKKISEAIVPGKTIWIFQDFERARLPWQVYSLAAIMEAGEILGGAKYGTLGNLYFRFTSTIDVKTREKILKDDFSMEERLNSVRSVFDAIRSGHLGFLPENKDNVRDLENTLMAYCHYWKNDIDEARKILRETSVEFLSHPANNIYSQEIFGKLG